MTHQYYAIIALSFGTGISNKYLAEVVEEISKEFPRAKLILQKEVADYEPVYGHPSELYWVIDKHRQRGKYLDTIEVLEQAREICVPDKEWNPPVIIVAHPDHLPRCLLVARTLGFEPAEGRVPYREIPYDKNSKQWWTRSHWRFMLWELAAYLKFFIQIKLGMNPFFF